MSARCTTSASRGDASGDRGLRAQMAKVALRAPARQSNSWRVLAPEVNGQALVASNNGFKGLWRPDQRIRVGQKYQLFPIRILPDPESKRFPYLELSSQPPSAPFPDIVEAEVLHWIEPTRVKVALDSTASANLRASPGTLLPGDRVAVLNVGADAAVERHLIGVTSICDPGQEDTWIGDTETRVKITRPYRSPGWHEGQCIPTGAPVLVHAREVPSVTVGSEIVAAYVGQDVTRGLATVMPLSTELPSSEDVAAS